MQLQNRTTLAIVILMPALMIAQPGPPPSYPPPELDRLDSRVALYPDPLLAQILAAATFPDQIPEAARWAKQHSYLRGEELARAISEDRLPWDPSVQALLPFPQVLDMMARDMNWTSQLGNAFLAERDAVMDAVQRMRRQARDYGYLRSADQYYVDVAGGGYIEIRPVNPYFIPVPFYDPGVVFVRPRRGFAVGGAITFGGVTIGAAFRPYGWGAPRYFGWDTHRVIINDRDWDRRWTNRMEYRHLYEVPRYEPQRREERQALRERREDKRERRRARRRAF